MPFKLNISDKGKAWKKEVEGDFLVGKVLNEKIEGFDLSPEFEGYEFEITGASDKSGFPAYSKLEGVGLKRVLFTKGRGMRDNRKGVRIRKSVRGKVISELIHQINLKVVKQGKKTMAEIFSDQNKVES